jgi:hypothetical protein
LPLCPGWNLMGVTPLRITLLTRKRIEVNAQDGPQIPPFRVGQNAAACTLYPPPCDVVVDKPTRQW